MNYKPAKITLSSLVALIALVFILCLPNGLEAGFIDLDGDGINDQMIDSDNNGIPDLIQNKVAKSDNLPMVTGMSIALPDFGPAIMLMSSADRFRVRDFGSRAISACRSDFDMFFGGGNGLGTGATGGSACAGGICR